VDVAVCQILKLVCEVRHRHICAAEQAPQHRVRVARVALYQRRGTFFAAGARIGIGFLHFGFRRGHGVSGYGPFLRVHHEFEAIRQQGLYHLEHCINVGVIFLGHNGGRFGDDVPAFGFHELWSAHQHVVAEPPDFVDERFQRDPPDCDPAAGLKLKIHAMIIGVRHLHFRDFEFRWQRRKGSRGFR
jgi:hypothetical protein